MYTCLDKETLQLYCDNELPAEQLHRHRRHVDGCEKCRLEVKRIRALGAAFGAASCRGELSAEELEASFARLQAHLHIRRVSETIRHRRRAVWWAIPALAAALALAMLTPMAVRRWAARNLPTDGSIETALQQVPGADLPSAAPVSAPLDSADMPLPDALLPTGPPVPTSPPDTEPVPWRSR
jgi:anti-sigma factor RsiW